MAGGPVLGERRHRMVAACEGVDGLGTELWRAGSVELEEVMAEADRMVAAGEAARVAVLAEVMSRGEVGSGAAALTPVQWVRRHAPSTRAGGAAQIVSVAQAFAVPGKAAVKDAVLSGVLPVRSAAVVLSEADKLLPLLVEQAGSTAMEGLIRIAAEDGPRECRRLRP